MRTVVQDNTSSFFHSSDSLQRKRTLIPEVVGQIEYVGCIQKLILVVIIELHLQTPVYKGRDYRITTPGWYSNAANPSLAQDILQDQVDSGTARQTVHTLPVTPERFRNGINPILTAYLRKTT